jgi:hypothetical protein
MPQDLIQIGSFIISKSVLDFLSPLFGTLIGGLITYLSIRASENRKRAQEKKDKIQEQQREALKIALQWLDPIHNVLVDVGLRSNPIGKKEIDMGDNWPDLIQKLKKFDIPRYLLVLLPQDPYKRSFELINRINDLGDVMGQYNKQLSSEEVVQYY